MSLQKQAARGLKWQAIEIGGRQALSLVVFACLARLLDPSAFGLLGLVVVYLAFVGMFIDQGIGVALIQRKDLEPGHINAAFWFNIVCAVIFCGLTIALAEPLATFFKEPKLERLLRWASLSLVINATAAVHHTLLIRALNFRSPAICTLVANLAGGVVGVGMALGGWGVWSLIGQQLAASLAGAVFLWRISPWRPSLTFSLASLRQLMGVGGSVFSIGLLWFFSSRLDQVVIGRALGAGVLGQYVVGSKLCDLARMALHQPIGAISLPTLSRLQDDYHRMRGAIYKGMELNALVSFAVFIGLAAVAGDLVPFAFGAAWGPAGRVCALLSVYTLLNALQVFFHPALLASGGPGGYVLVNVLHAIGVVVACMVGTRHGVSILILGLITNGLVIAVLALLFLRRRIGLSPRQYCRPCVVPLVASLAMVGAVWSIRAALLDATPQWLNIGSQVVGGAIVYVTVISWLARDRLMRLAELVAHALGRSSSKAVTSNTPVMAAV